MNHNLGETQHLDKKTAINVKDEKFGATIQGGGGVETDCLLPSHAADVVNSVE